MINQSLDICFISDNGYIVPTTVAISTLLKSRNAESRVNVFIVAADLSAESEQHFMEFESDGVTIKVIRSSSQDLASFHVYSSKSMCVASPSALLKFSLGELLPHLDKVLYLDGDILVRHDLADLFEIDLGNDLVAAVPDSGKMYSSRKIMHSVRSYFNSGVLLLNLKRMREGGYAQILLEAKRKSSDASLMDQNIFNEVFDGYVRPLPVRYNCLFTNLARAHSEGKFSIGKLNAMYGTQYRDLSEVRDDAAILHFASKEKPWKYDCIPMIDAWDAAYRVAYSAEADALEREHADEVLSSFVPDQLVVVSLTTFPARIGGVHAVVRSILSQTHKPDKIVIWLAEDEFPEGDAELPQSLTSLFSEGVEVRWTDCNLRPHNKYYHSFKAFPKDIVITIDDDVVYPKHLIGTLLSAHRKCPGCVVAMRAHLITFDDKGLIRPYSEWKFSCRDYIERPNMALFATGVGGVLYPPGLFGDELFSPDKIRGLCMSADDVWLKCAEVCRGVPVVVPRGAEYALELVDGSQVVRLFDENVYGFSNDECMSQVFSDTAFARPDGATLSDVILKQSEAAEIGIADLVQDRPSASIGRPIVSVILTVRNAERYLDESLRAIENQSLKEIEIICLDDGSTDLTWEILSRHAVSDPRFGLYRRKRCGFAALRNFGLSVAWGRYVLFTDCAAVLTNQAMHSLVDPAERLDSDIVFVGKKLQRGDLCGILRSAYISRLRAKLFRRSFLVERGLKFDENRIGDPFLPFLASCLVVDARLDFIDKDLYSRNKKYIDTYMGTLENYPLVIVDLLEDVLKVLRESGRYEGCIQDYRILALSICYKTIVERKQAASCEALYAYLRETGLARLGLDKLKMTDIGKLWWGRYLAVIQNQTPVALLKIEMGELAKRKPVERVVIKHPSVDTRRIASLEQSLAGTQAEVKALKDSEAYRIGMIVTWPVRAMYRVMRKHA